MEQNIGVFEKEMEQNSDFMTPSETEILNHRKKMQAQQIHYE